MKLIDANVLIYAAHSEAVDHARYLGWLDDLYRSNEWFAQSELIAAAFIRITTNAKAWRDPFTIQEALNAYGDIRSRPRCRWLNPSVRHWSVFSDLCRHTPVKANLVNDAWLAALAIEHDFEIISVDRDFARFPGLRWRHPLDP